MDIFFFAIFHFSTKSIYQHLQCLHCKKDKVNGKKVFVIFALIAVLNIFYRWK